MSDKKELVLEVGKTYLTASGHKVRVLCNDLNDSVYPVVAAVMLKDFESVEMFTKDGESIYGKDSAFNITEEYSFWSGVEVDTAIFVSHVNERSTLKRHFAKYENGNVFFFEGGNTSWSSSGILSFFDKTKDVRLATREEIEKSKKEV